MINERSVKCIHLQPFADFSSVKNLKRIKTSFLFTFAVWPAVTSLVDPVYVNGLRHTDQHSHFDLQPFVWPIVSGERGVQPCTTGLTQHFLCKLSSSVSSWPWGRGAPGCLTMSALHSLSGCPSSHYNLLITTVPLREREGGKKPLPPDWLLLVELLLRGGFYSVMDRCGSWWGATSLSNIYIN